MVPLAKWKNVKFPDLLAPCVLQVGLHQMLLKYHLYPHHPSLLCHKLNRFNLFTLPKDLSEVSNMFENIFSKGLV